MTGPDAVLVAAWGALEVAVGLLIGMAAGGRGAGALAGGFAVPLAAEREGASIRDFFGFGRGGDEAATADADEQPTEAVEPLPADEQQTESIEPLPADEQQTESIEPLPEAVTEDTAEDTGAHTETEADRSSR